MEDRDSLQDYIFRNDVLRPAVFMKTFYSREGMLDEAVKVMEELMAREDYGEKCPPSDHMVNLLGLTLLYYDEEQFGKAIETGKLTQAAMENELGVHSVITVFMVELQGYLYEMMGEEQKSEEIFDMILEESPCKDLQELVMKLRCAEYLLRKKCNMPSFMKR